MAMRSVAPRAWRTRQATRCPLRAQVTLAAGRAVLGRGEPGVEGITSRRVAHGDVLAPRVARVAAGSEALTRRAGGRRRGVVVREVAECRHVLRLPGRGRGQRR